MGMREQIVKALLGKAKAPLAGKVGGPWEGGIRAYHSSPHDFDKVDFSKLRTGEGANVYGAGHYMAENPAVSGQGGQYWQQFLHKFSGPERETAERLKAAGFDRSVAAGNIDEEIAWLEYNIKHANSPEAAAKNAEMLSVLRRLEGSQPVGPRTYEMNLRAKPEELLDWDKPLREQPQLLDALSGSRRKAVHETLKAHDYEAPTRAVYGRDIGPVTGQDFYKALSLNLTGKTVTPQASDALRAGGIPGIRYLDEGSRTTAARLRELEPQLELARRRPGVNDWALRLEENLKADPLTYNYVGTDPSRLDVLAKYGVAGAAAIPPTLGAFTRQDDYEGAR